MFERKKITHVAIRFNGVIYSLPAPNRHHNVISHIVETTNALAVDAYDEDEGFLDEDGRYLNRKQALVNAMEHDQVKDVNNIRCGQLFSEDVW